MNYCLAKFLIFAWYSCHLCEFVALFCLNMDIVVLLCSVLEVCTVIWLFLRHLWCLDCIIIIIIIIIIIMAYTPDSWTSKRRRYVRIRSVCDDLCLGKVLSTVLVSCVTAVTGGLGTSLWPARSFLSLPTGSPWPLSVCSPPCCLQTWWGIEFDTSKTNKPFV